MYHLSCQVSIYIYTYIKCIYIYIYHIDSYFCLVILYISIYVCFLPRNIYIGIRIIWIGWKQIVEDRWYLSILFRGLHWYNFYFATLELLTVTVGDFPKDFPLVFITISTAVCRFPLNVWLWGTSKTLQSFQIGCWNFRATAMTLKSLQYDPPKSDHHLEGHGNEPRDESTANKIHACCDELRDESTGLIWGFWRQTSEIHDWCDVEEVSFMNQSLEHGCRMVEVPDSITWTFTRGGGIHQVTGCVFFRSLRSVDWDNGNQMNMWVGTRKLWGISRQSHQSSPTLRPPLQPLIKFRASS